MGQIVRGEFHNPELKKNDNSIEWDTHPYNIVRAKILGISAIGKDGKLTEANDPGSKPWVLLEIEIVVYPVHHMGATCVKHTIIYDGEVYKRIYKVSSVKRQYKLAPETSALAFLTVIDKQMLDKLIESYL